MKSNIIIVGKGSIGIQHFNTLKNLGVHVEIVSGRSLMSLEKDAKSKFISKYTHILIALPIQFRGDLLVLAMDLGLSIYCEKPLLKSYDELTALKRRNPQQLYVGYMLRFSEAFRQFKIIYKGLNSPYLLSVHVGSDLTTWRKSDWRIGYAMEVDGGGVLLDLSHELDLIFNLTDENFSIRDVISMDGRSHEDVDFITQVSLTSTSLIANITMDYVNRIGVRSIRVCSIDENITLDLKRNIISDDFKVVHSFNDSRQDFFNKAMCSWLEERDDLKFSNLTNVKSVEKIIECYLERKFVGKINLENI